LQRSVGNEVLVRFLANAAAATASTTPVPQPTNDAGTPSLRREPGVTSDDVTGEKEAASPDGGQKWQARGPWYNSREQTGIAIGARGRASPGAGQMGQNLRPGLAFAQEPSADAGHASTAKEAPGPASGGAPGALGPKSNKVDVSYANLRSRDAQYENEFTLGAEPLKNVHTNALKHVQAGTYPSVAAYMQHNFGWRPADTAKYFDKIPAIGTASPDKPVVEAVAPQDRANYELSGGTTFIRGGGVKYDTSGSYSKFKGVGFGIFVMGSNGKIYAGDHRIGLFHHSSLLAGGAVAGAGELKVIGGALKWITNKSGHYTPTAAQTIQVLAELQRRGVDLAAVDYTHLSAKTNVNNFDPFPGKALAFYTKFKDQPELADQ